MPETKISWLIFMSSLLLNGLDEEIESWEDLLNKFIESSNTEGHFIQRIQTSLGNDISQDYSILKKSKVLKNSDSTGRLNSNVSNYLFSATSKDNYFGISTAEKIFLRTKVNKNNSGLYFRLAKGNVVKNPLELETFHNYISSFKEEINSIKNNFELTKYHYPSRVVEIMNNDAILSERVVKFHQKLFDLTEIEKTRLDNFLKKLSQKRIFIENDNSTSIPDTCKIEALELSLEYYNSIQAVAFNFENWKDSLKTIPNIEDYIAFHKSDLIVKNGSYIKFYDGRDEEFSLEIIDINNSYTDFIQEDRHANQVVTVKGQNQSKSFIYEMLDFRLLNKKANIFYCEEVDQIKTLHGRNNIWLFINDFSVRYKLNILQEFIEKNRSCKIIINDRGLPLESLEPNTNHNYELIECVLKFQSTFKDDCFSITEKVFKEKGIDITTEERIKAISNSRSSMSQINYGLIESHRIKLKTVLNNNAFDWQNFQLYCDFQRIDRSLSKNIYNVIAYFTINNIKLDLELLTYLDKSKSAQIKLVVCANKLYFTENEGTVKLNSREAGKRSLNDNCIEEVESFIRDLIENGLSNLYKDISIIHLIRRISNNSNLASSFNLERSEELFNFFINYLEENIDCIDDLSFGNILMYCYYFRYKTDKVAARDFILRIFKKDSGNISALDKIIKHDLIERKDDLRDQRINILKHHLGKAVNIFKNQPFNNYTIKSCLILLSHCYEIEDNQPVIKKERTKLRNYLTDYSTRANLNNYNHINEGRLVYEKYLSLNKPKWMTPIINNYQKQENYNELSINSVIRILCNWPWVVEDKKTIALFLELIVTHLNQIPSLLFSHLLNKMLSYKTEKHLHIVNQLLEERKRLKLTKDSLFIENTSKALELIRFKQELKPIKVRFDYFKELGSDELIKLNAKYQNLKAFFLKFDKNDYTQAKRVKLGQLYDLMYTYAKALRKNTVLNEYYDKHLPELLKIHEKPHKDPHIQKIVKDRLLKNKNYRLLKAYLTFQRNRNHYLFLEAQRDIAKFTGNAEKLNEFSKKIKKGNPNYNDENDFLKTKLHYTKRNRITFSLPNNVTEIGTNITEEIIHVDPDERFFYDEIKYKSSTYSNNIEPYFTEDNYLELVNKYMGFDETT